MVNNADCKSFQANNKSVELPTRHFCNVRLQHLSSLLGKRMRSHDLGASRGSAAPRRNGEDPVLFRKLPGGWRDDGPFGQDQRAPSLDGPTDILLADEIEGRLVRCR